MTIDPNAVIALLSALIELARSLVDLVTAMLGAVVALLGWVVVARGCGGLRGRGVGEALLTTGGYVLRCEKRGIERTRDSMNTIPVASAPSDNAATYAQTLQDAQRHNYPHTEPTVDAETPEGHFIVTVENIGGVQTYVFRGPLGDPDARIVGRTQRVNGKTLHYVGGSHFGGTFTRR